MKDTTYILLARRYLYRRCRAPLRCEPLFLRTGFWQKGFIRRRTDRIMLVTGRKGISTGQQPLAHSLAPCYQ